jgi:hypothetical protein
LRGRLRARHYDVLEPGDGNVQPEWPMGAVNSLSVLHMPAGEREYPGVVAVLLG